MLKHALLFLSVYAASALAQVEVSFLEVRDSKGEIVVLEPDFPYAHVVLSVNDRFLHSHPSTGVRWVELNVLERFGKIKESFSVELQEEEVQKAERWVGRPYDSHFSWDNEKFYCSELVAKILGIAPEPMHFEPGLWPPGFSSLEGELGISPGKIYRKIKGRDFSFD